MTAGLGGMGQMTKAIFRALAIVTALFLGTSLPPARAADPIKIGFSMALTGGNAGAGQQILAALQIWREEINAKGGLLGRPVEFVYYDDQTNPTTVPGIYTKLLEVDKVDLLLGPYATNMAAAAIPTLIEHKRASFGILATAANSQFHYPGYFSINNTGPDPERAVSTGFFEIAMAQNPKPKTIALAGSDAEFGQNALAGARANAKAAGLQIVYDRAYPPPTADFTPIVRAIQATSPDIVYVAAYPPDSIGFIRAANQVGLKPKQFGGFFIGVGIAAMKMQLGPLMNGIVNYGALLPTPNVMTPELDSLMKKYQERAKSLGIDPLGWTFAPFGYATGEVIAAAVNGTQSLDHAKIIDYLHSHPIKTILATFSFGPDGEWTTSDTMFYQMQGIKNGSLEEVGNVDRYPIVWPDKLKTGTLIYPYADAQK
jgi:branched-chain amino acid transport system substrate-binding protein